MLASFVDNLVFLRESIGTSGALAGTRHEIVTRLALADPTSKQPSHTPQLVLALALSGFCMPLHRLLSAWGPCSWSRLPMLVRGWRGT
eukprot:6425921-Amphidinium_carterae.1